MSFVALRKMFYKSYTHYYLLLNFVDINECLLNPCHANASCNDSQGSFICQCNIGYSGNGLNCSSMYILHWYTVCKTFYCSSSHLSLLISLDINECLSIPCHANASCTDTQGSFVCECNTGYSGTGFNCSSKYVCC